MDIEKGGITLSRQRITKTLIRLDWDVKPQHNQPTDQTAFVVRIWHKADLS